ncbi:MAG: hydrogenase maturation protease [Deltaproteobacteria bacterium]|nr:hydrogenase maturation protease [Deltaproteobacteria bacterium]
MTHIKVLCIGNALVADDAFGPKVYEHFSAQSLPPNISFRMLGVGGLDLLSEFEAEDLVVVVDAVNTGKPPGTLCVLPWQEIERVAGSPVTSHDIGLDEVIKIGQLTQPEQMPKNVIFLGVEGKDFKSVGAPLSPAVESAFTPAIDELKRLLKL